MYIKSKAKMHEVCSLTCNYFLFHKTAFIRNQGEDSSEGPYDQRCQLKKKRNLREAHKNASKLPKMFSQKRPQISQNRHYPLYQGDLATDTGDQEI